MLLTVAAAPASAADVTFDPYGLTITGSPGESSRLTVRFDPDVTATVHDDAGGLRPGPGCLGTVRDVSCAILGPGCIACTVAIDLRDGNDTVSLDGRSQKGPSIVEAGDGDDEVHMVGASNAIVRGGAGRDLLRADTSSELDGGDGPTCCRATRRSPRTRRAPRP